MTRYYLSYQPKNGQRANRTDFSSLTLRTLFVLDHAQDIVVLATWEQNDTEAAA